MLRLYSNYSHIIGASICTLAVFIEASILGIHFLIKKRRPSFQCLIMCFSGGTPPAPAGDFDASAGFFFNTLVRRGSCLTVADATTHGKEST